MFARRFSCATTENVCASTQISVFVESLLHAPSLVRCIYSCPPVSIGRSLSFLRRMPSLTTSRPCILMQYISKKSTLSLSSLIACRQLPLLTEPKASDSARVCLFWQKNTLKECMSLNPKNLSLVAKRRIRNENASL